MSSNKRARVIIGGGVAALVVILAVPGREESAPPAASAVTPVDYIAQAASGPKLEDLLAAQTARAADLTWARDPFSGPREASADAAVAPAILLHLSGISTFGDSRMAIIDEAVVTPGDRLATGHTVVEITDTTVLLELDLEHTTLHLGAAR